MKKEFIPKNRKLVNNINLNKLELIAVGEEIIDTKINFLYQKISQKYRIDEDEIYDSLYLKVRKMFLEEER